MLEQIKESTCTRQATPTPRYCR